MRARAALSIVAAAGLWVLSTVPASAVTLTVLDNGLTALSANYACPTGYTNCSTQRDLQLGAPADVTGTIEINAALTTAYIDFQLVSATFTPLAAGSAVTFENVSYTGTVPISAFGASVFQLGPGTGSVTGTANGVPFAVSPSIFNLNCSNITAAGQCGVQFGVAGFGAISGHYFVNTFNVLVTPVPEPAAAVLVIAGLAGLVRRVRRS